MYLIYNQGNTCGQKKMLKRGELIKIINLDIFIFINTLNLNFN